MNLERLDADAGLTLGDVNHMTKMAQFAVRMWQDRYFNLQQKFFALLLERGGRATISQRTILRVSSNLEIHEWTDPATGDHVFQVRCKKGDDT